MKDSVFQKRFERKQQNRQVHGQQLTVFYRDMVSDFPVSSLAMLMLRRCESSVSPSLYRQMANGLIGFEEALQLDMAECLTGSCRALHSTQQASSMLTEFCGLCITKFSERWLITLAK